jgi:4-amino-4-deoxy-L-arabinose transferase-like glycosyltransferase
MTTRFAFAAGAIVVLAASVILRTAWLSADPPAHPSIGIVWHDEGAWVHNARNRALWGSWRTDAWNPVFVTPVFTALEYAAFRSAGVGTWQARLVPVVSGVLSVAFLMVGLRALAGPRAALAGGALVAANYVFVMWNRAALIESTMILFIVMSWALYALADRRPAWALLAGAAASLAWFTKAAAAFFVAALVIDALYGLVRRPMAAASDERAAARYALGGLAIVTVGIIAAFVLPHWEEYAFYNWQMSVTRKPDYSLGAIVDRLTWLPLVHGTFARSWPVLVVGALGLVWTVRAWPEARPADRLLVLWIVVGLAELVVHDAGNERRYVMFIPAIVALAVRWAAPLNVREAPPGPHGIVQAAAFGLVGVSAYLVAGSALRILLEADVTAGRLSTAVRLAAAAAAAVLLIVVLRRQQVGQALVRLRTMPGLLPLVVIAGLAWNAGDYAAWLRHRSSVNLEASEAVGRILAPGTLVQGKLAAGLALENRIRPLFIGNGFGNYADRFTRDDVRYILTYDLPRLGYESSDGSNLIKDLVDRYPNHRVVAAFPVDEGPLEDRAILIDKHPPAPETDARD